MNSQYPDFDEYIRQVEPGKKEKASIWQTAIGLQAVDGLTTSDYLKQTARKHIEGEINIDEVRDLIKTYYQSKTKREPDDDEKQEADKVSANITKILSSESFDFSSKGFVALHRRIFEGVFKHAGKVRDYDISKKEWVLEYESVNYLNWEDLQRAVEYDIEQERQYSYQGVSSDEFIKHLTRFVSGLWQIHPFGEGNTRTTAVFTILYLRHIGFKVDNNMFADHSWYFRNALVRANYKSAVKGIDYSPVYLERFFRNMLLGEQWDLRNRYLHIHPAKEWSLQPNLAAPASTPASTPASNRGNLILTDNPNIKRLVFALADKQMSVKEMIHAVGLKDRMNFMEYTLAPAISDGYVRMLYPQSPRHPRQLYMLTAKGLALYQELSKLP